MKLPQRSVNRISRLELQLGPLCCFGMLFRRHDRLGLAWADSSHQRGQGQVRVNLGVEALGFACVFSAVHCCQEWDQMLQVLRGLFVRLLDGPLRVNTDAAESKTPADDAPYSDYLSSLKLRCFEPAAGRVQVELAILNCGAGV